MVQDYRLRAGMRFTVRGREYRVEGRLPNGKVKIRDLITDEASARSVSDLVNDLFAGQLELLGDSNERARLKSKFDETRTTDLTPLSDDDPLKREAIRRSHYVKEVLRCAMGKRTRETLVPVITAVSARVGDARPPSWVTVNRWFRIFVAAGHDVRALVPAYKARGNTRAKTAGRVLDRYSDEDREKAEVVAQLMDQTIRTKYLSPERPTVRAVYEAVAVRINAENRYRDPTDQLPTPHPSSIYKIIKKLKPYEADTARFGHRYAEQKYKVSGPGPRPTRPLERVECDHTKLDLMVIDTETRLPLGRPWLTSLLDVYSRMVLGIYLGFHCPGYVSVMLALRHAIRPKTYLKTVYPHIEHDWPTYGIPELIVTDNAKEFYSGSFEDACLQLGIEIEYAPPREAWYKGSIERWFGTQNTRLLHELPGTTFSNIFAKKDYDPQKHAVISLAALLEMVHIWIVDVYHQSVHRGLQDIPDRKWQEGIAAWPPNLPPQSGELDVLIGCVAHRTIGRSGIELFTLRYHCDELGLLRRNLAAGEKVMIKYDPADLSIVYVWDTRGNRFLPVPALDQDYTRNLSVWQHEVIRNYARQRVNGHVDTAALCRAKEQIQAIVERERWIKRRLARGQRNAHYLGLGQPNYPERLTLGVAPAEDKSDPADRFRQETALTECPVKVSQENKLTESQSAGARTMNDVSRPGGAEGDLLTSARRDDFPLPSGAGWGADYSLPTGGRNR